MKRRCLLSAAIICTALNANAWASSPLPTFDKEAVTTHPYNRMEQENFIEGNVPQVRKPFQEGNTGTAKEPAFFIKTIKLTGEPVPDKAGRLAKVLEKFTNRSVKISELQNLATEITEYCKSYGYTIPQAVIPEQEIINGELIVKIYLTSYGNVKITENTSDIADSVLNNYINYLRKGEIMTDKKLESALNNLNDLPGVSARAVLRPGSKPVTTDVDIEIANRRVWNNYLFTDNGGGYYSGRYRYGFNTELNNPGHNGDKIILNGMLSSHDVKNYGVRYETPLGSRGTRVGIAYSKSDYELDTNIFYTSMGESEGISIYGMTPIYRDKSNRITAIYGYDNRDITDEYRLHLNSAFSPKFEKSADVWHVGISGSQYNVNQFTQYNLIYWYGEIDSKNGTAFYDGAYHKLTGDVLNIWYDNRFNYRINASGQIANRALDGSEQFYLGGMNGVRAYGSSDGYGDIGYLASAEVRYQTDVKGLELAAFVDTGAVNNRADRDTEQLSGWGVGLRYAQPGEWYAQLDYARKIDGRPDRADPTDHDGRLWFQAYRMF